MEVRSQGGQTRWVILETSLMGVVEGNTRDAAWCDGKKILEMWVLAQSGPLCCCVSPHKLFALLLPTSLSSLFQDPET